MGLPVLHIADSTGETIVDAGLAVVGLLGTKFTMEGDFYRDRLRRRHGLEVLTPDAEDRETVHRVIYDELCRGEIRDASRREFARVLAALVDRGAEGVILGCTEISLLVGAGDASVPLFDTTEIHARKAVDWALGYADEPVAPEITDVRAPHTFPPSWVRHLVRLPRPTPSLRRSRLPALQAGAGRGGAGRRGCRRWRRSTPLLSLLVVATVFLSCASAGPKPRTGDIAFRLSWTGAADLDLYVRDPEGQRLSFANRESDSGGILDIDCNATPEQLCRKPLENVYWPQGNAPPGKYSYSVHFLQTHDGKETVRFTIQILLGETVVKSNSGTLTVDQEAGPYEFIYAAR